MTNWNEVKLRDCCSKIGSGATPRGGKDAYVDEGISLIRSQNVLDFSFSKDGLAFINEVQANQLKNVIVEADDVLINITGDSVARVCTVPSNIVPARVNQHVAILRPNKDILDNRYLKYYLLIPSVKSELLSLSSSGATRNALTKLMLEDFKIDIPDLPTQIAIAEILSSLDDKIELNNEMNKTLEELAQTLFKRWFVDFEFPDENGNLYKSSGGEMVESELGLIPKGWRVGQFDELINIRSGKGLKRDEFKIDGEYPVVGANGELGRTDVYLEDCKVLNTGRVGTLGAVKISYGKKWYSDNVLIIKPTNYFYYSYEILKSIDMNALNRGSTQPLITQTDLKEHTTIIADESILNNFEERVSSLFESIFNNQMQNNFLVQMRDRILPKLMSGQIEV